MVRSLAALVMISACRYGFDGPLGDATGGRDDGVAEAGAPDAVTDGTASDSSLVCPSLYVPINSLSSRYRLVSSTDPWLIAEQACEADGWHLAIVDDTNELQSLVAAASGTIWTGVTDRKTVGAWLAVSGASASYLPWAVSEPDAGIPECVQAAADFTIADQDCTSGRQFLCECDGLLVDATSY